MNAEDLNEIFSCALGRNLNTEECVIQAFGRLNQEASHKSEALLGWDSFDCHLDSTKSHLGKDTGRDFLPWVGSGAHLWGLFLTALMDVGKSDLWYRPRQRTCFRGNVFTHLAFTVWQVHLPRGCCREFLHWYQNQLFQVSNRDWSPASSQKYAMPLMPDWHGWDIQPLGAEKLPEFLTSPVWVSHCWIIPYTPWNTISDISL